MEMDRKRWPPRERQSVKTCQWQRGWEGGRKSWIESDSALLSLNCISSCRWVFEILKKRMTLTYTDELLFIVTGEVLSKTWLNENAWICLFFCQQNWSVTFQTFYHSLTLKMNILFLINFIVNNYGITSVLLHHGSTRYIFMIWLTKPLSPLAKEETSCLPDLFSVNLSYLSYLWFWSFMFWETQHWH